jgi:hypothetical protein
VLYRPALGKDKHEHVKDSDKGTTEKSTKCTNVKDERLNDKDGATTNQGISECRHGRNSCILCNTAVKYNNEMKTKK